MPRAPSFGVILPTYQSECYIAETLESIFKQTVLPKEVLISDDGSRDNTSDLVRVAAAKAPFPVRFVVNNAPAGITSNYLNALRHASSCDYVAVADHDDVWLPHRLECLLDAFMRNPGVALVCCDSLLADNQLNLTGGSVRGGFAKSTRICQHHRRLGSFSSYLKGGLPCLAHTLAFSFSLREAILAKPSTIPEWFFEEWLTSVAACYGDLVLIPEALTLYRRHPQQASHASRQAVKVRAGNATPQARPASIKSRLLKLEHCRSILQGMCSSTGWLPVASVKLTQIDDACRFLSARLVVQDPSIRLGARLRVLFNLALSGGYRRYASGLRSICKDVVSILNSLALV
ncbi:MAG: glycosyltransferase [Cyanobacteria bacterium J06638_7]